MKAIEKLSLVSGLSILFMLSPIFYLVFKANLFWTLVSLAAILFSILIRKIYYREDEEIKKLKMKWAYESMPLYYLLGSVLLIYLIFFSTLIYKNLSLTYLLPLLITALAVGAIIEILIIYYSIKAYRESKNLKPKTKEENERESQITNQVYKKSFNQTMPLVIGVYFIQFFLKGERNIGDLIFPIPLILSIYLIILLATKNNKKLPLILIGLLVLLLCSLIILAAMLMG